jgi:hypothetical protein
VQTLALELGQLAVRHVQLLASFGGLNATFERASMPKFIESDQKCSGINAKRLAPEHPCSSALAFGA